MRDLFIFWTALTCLLGCVDSGRLVPSDAPCAAVDSAVRIGDSTVKFDVLEVDTLSLLWDASPLEEFGLVIDAEPEPICPFGQRRECVLSDLVGPCSRGLSICLEVAWGPCLQEVFPRREWCDGVDSDCDGVIDEALTRPCYTGDRHTRKVGPCRGGIQHCVNGDFGLCVGEIVPEQEQCDLLDNDCDGEVDEGVQNACGQCGDLPEEMCNFEDDDCDSEVDEGAGNCECDNPLYIPQPETCNGLDDDCDMRIDEGVAGPLTALCLTRLDGTVQTFAQAEDIPHFEGGACRAGLAFCAARQAENGELEHGYFSCLEEVRPAFERCNGLDDDCDGDVDEGFGQGQVGVLFVVDVSGSMDLAELEEVFVTTQQAVHRLHGQGAISACYSLAVVGTDAQADPLLVSPADQCVVGVQDPPQNPRIDLITAIGQLRGQVRGGHIPRGGVRESTLDAIGNWFSDDLVDVDQDGALDDVSWFSDDPQHPVRDIDLSRVPYRIVVVLGDEEAQGQHWTDPQIADIMRQAGGIAYILGPSTETPTGRAVRDSYEHILRAGGVYVPMRQGAGDQQQGRIAEGVLQAIEELECLAEDAGEDAGDQR